MKNVFDSQKSFPKIREALRQYGIDIETTPPAAVATEIKQRPAAIREYLLAALDDCLQLAPTEEIALRLWLIAVIDAADRNAWRAQVRQAWKNPAEGQQGRGRAASRFGRPATGSRRCGRGDQQPSHCRGTRAQILVVKYEPGALAPGKGRGGQSHYPLPRRGFSQDSCESAADCKSAIPGSNPGGASSLLPLQDSRRSPNSCPLAFGMSNRIECMLPRRGPGTAGKPWSEGRLTRSARQAERNTPSSEPIRLPGGGRIARRHVKCAGYLQTRPGPHSECPRASSFLARTSPSAVSAKNCADSRP